MNNTKQSNIKFQEITAWFAITVITIAALFGTYHFHFSSPIKVMIWIGWLVFVLGTGFMTTKGKEFYSFAVESKAELEKVVWPTRQETIQITSIVMIMVTVTGFVLWGVDSSMLWAIGKITHLG